MGSLRARDRTVGKKLLKYRRSFGMKLGIFRYSIPSSWTLVNARK